MAGSDKRRFSDMEHRTSSGYGGSQDHPPYSRLFIICSKSTTEDDLREEFSRFGNIEELWMVKDRTTGEPKGVAYIKYSLTSEAAKALEEMNGRTLKGGTRSIKVLIAHSRGEGSKKEPLEEERLLRLFVVIKKTSTEEDLESYFKKFGPVDSIKIVRDHATNENKGFAYIKFIKMSHAALAFEGCDRSYRAVFAEPRPPVKNLMMRNSGNSNTAFNNANNNGFDRSFEEPSFNNTAGSNYGRSINNIAEPYGTKLQILVSPVVPPEHYRRLFDLCPGLEFFRLFPDYRAKSPNDRLSGVIGYQTPQQAAYAREKLNNFEYPPGQPISLRFDPSNANAVDNAHVAGSAAVSSAHALNNSMLTMPQSGQTLTKADVEMLAENIKRATALLKAHAGMVSPSAYDPNYCTAKLPPPRNFDDDNGTGEERVFVVFNPSVPERQAVRDVFGRFGRLIDIFLLPNKNVGYITYTNKESVVAAIQALHGQELCGIYMKVMEAEPRRPHPHDDERRKRIRTEME